LKKEKEDIRGNGKFDLNIGLDNTRIEVTVNTGYDTKGKNVRSGIGFRVIY
jgi:fusobacterium outer membrane protein family